MNYGSNTWTPFISFRNTSCSQDGSPSNAKSKLRIDFWRLWNYVVFSFFFGFVGCWLFWPLAMLDMAVCTRCLERNPFQIDNKFALLLPSWISRISNRSEIFPFFLRSFLGVRCIFLFRFCSGKSSAASEFLHCLLLTLGFICQRQDAVFSFKFILHISDGRAMRNPRARKKIWNKTIPWTKVLLVLLLYCLYYSFAVFRTNVGSRMFFLPYLICCFCIMLLLFLVCHWFCLVFLGFLAR